MMKKGKNNLKLKQKIEEAYGVDDANSGCGLLVFTGVGCLSLVFTIYFAIWKREQQLLLWGTLIFGIILIIICLFSYKTIKNSKLRRENFIKGSDPELFDADMEEEQKMGVVNLLDTIEHEDLHYRNKDVIITDNYVVTLFNKPLISRLDTLKYVVKEKEIKDAIKVKFVFKSGKERFVLCKHKQEYAQFTKMLKDINIEIKE